VGYALAHRAELAERFDVQHLALFGSAARDTLGPESDVDVLVSFDGPATFDRFMDLKFRLEKLLGRRVDLVTANALRPRLAEAISAELVDVA
jgi:uncharacterized protein